MTDFKSKGIGAVDTAARSGGQGFTTLPKPSILVNEGLEVPGMRVILAPIDGLTKKGIMVDGSGKPRSFRFQMPPTESFTRSLSHGHSDYDTLRVGQHSRPAGQQLQSVRFQTLIVDWDVPWAVYPNSKKFDDTFGTGYSTVRDEFWNLLNVTDQLEEILESGSPVKLYAGQPALWEGGGGEDGWDVNMPVTLRSMNVEERAGEPDARYIDVEFVEYRSLKLNRRRLGKKTTTPSRGTGKRPTVIEVYPDGRIFDLGTQSQICGAHKGTPAFLGKHFWGNPKEGMKVVRANPILSQFVVMSSSDLGRVVEMLGASQKGRPYKLRVPYGPDVVQNQKSYLDPNDADALGIIPEESL